MPTAKSHRRGSEEKNRRGRLAEKASSFHGRIPGTTMGEKLIRPRTVPDLLASGRNGGGYSPEVVRPPRLTKLLLNVTVERSPGPIQVVMSPESTVGDLIAAALRQYAKEGRRPAFSSAEASTAGFGLHYSQFSLESLSREEKLMNLGSRNFFLCPKRTPTESGGGDGGGSITNNTTSLSCGKEAEKATKIGRPKWFKFMDFLL